MPTTVSTRKSGPLNPTRQQLDELDALLQRMLELPVAKVENTEMPVEVEEKPPMPEPVAIRPAPAPVSYMVVETASPRPLPLASGFAPQPSRLVPVAPLPEPEPPESETPAFETLPQADAPILPAMPDPVTPPMEAVQETKDKDELWVPLRSTWQPSPQTWPPLADSWHQAQGAPPVQREITPAPEIVETPSQPEPAPQPVVMESTPVEAKEPTLPAAPIIEPRLSLTAADAPGAVSGLLVPLVWLNRGFEACLGSLGAPGRWLCGPSGRQVLGFVGLTCLAAALAIVICAGLGCTW